MNTKLFNNLLLFSLFGIALGFFGMLYEGVVTIPKMLDTSMTRMFFWRDYYGAINPISYYIPLTPLGTLTLVVLYFVTAKQKPAVKKQLGWASILQITALAITFYMVKGINLKQYFRDIAQYAAVIPAKTVLVNGLSILRLVVAAIALILTFQSYIKAKTEA